MDFCIRCVKLWWVWLSWLEHWVVAPEVKGSSPFTHPNGFTFLMEK